MRSYRYVTKYLLLSDCLCGIVLKKTFVSAVRQKERSYHGDAICLEAELYFALKGYVKSGPIETGTAESLLHCKRRNSRVRAL